MKCIVIFTLLILSFLCFCDGFNTQIGYNLKSSSTNLENCENVNKAIKNIGIFGISILLFNFPAIAADPLPSLDRCYTAILSELNSGKDTAIYRLETDINSENWEDLKLFTREYDAGFRGGVLKPAWKQMDSEKQKKAIEITNSFTFDLIALNKAGRVKDVSEARSRIEQIKTDLKDFIKLKEDSQ
eukprot:gene8064-10924_t